MRRFIDEKLKRWKERPQRKPLILRGARQVGKTWSLKEFGKNYFDAVVVVDLERNPALRRVFDGDLRAARICADLEVLHSLVGCIPCTIHNIRAGDRLV